LSRTPREGSRSFAYAQDRRRIWKPFDKLKASIEL
jgi:hypothetical protein